MAIPLETLQANLADAQTAMHKLVTGSMEASVSYDGKSVTYTQADLYRLEAYIAGLQSQINGLTGATTRRGPVLFEF